MACSRRRHRRARQWNGEHFTAEFAWLYLDDIVVAEESRLIVFDRRHLVYVRGVRL